MSFRSHHPAQFLRPTTKSLNNKTCLEQPNLIRYRKRRRQMQLVVRWLGYSPEHDSLEPEANMSQDVTSVLDT